MPDENGQPFIISIFAINSYEHRIIFNNMTMTRRKGKRSTIIQARDLKNIR